MCTSEHYMFSLTCTDTKVDPMRATSCICRIAAPVSATLATKVLKQRPGTVQRAKDVYLSFCELEQADTVVVRQ